VKLRFSCQWFYENRRNGRKRSRVGRYIIPVLVPVDEAGHHGVGIGARANEEDDDEEEGLEVEDCGLLGGERKRVVS
jgi:hypothetical protein